MKRSRKKRLGGGTFRFDWSAIGVEDATSKRAIRRAARRLAAPPNRERRCYGKAKTLTREQIVRVVAYLNESSRVPESDVLKVFLSHYAGLRACEIAGLTLRDVTDATGRAVGKHICVPATIAKGGYGRQVPMIREVAEAIEAFMRAHPESERLAISSRRGRTQSPNALAAWFWQMYRRLGYQGCSSHSGRRYYITELARVANQHGCSLVDVQALAGHARLDSTQSYIDPSFENQFALAASLGDGLELPTTREGIALYVKAQEINERRRAGNTAGARRAA